MKIGFIGLGIMGSRMARNLQREGHQLIVHNRTKNKAAELLKQGAQWAETPLQLAAESELVITMLSTPEVVEEVAFGQQGFVAGMTADQIWINCSTINPSAARKLAAAARQAHIHYVDAPVAGTKGPAETGELLFLVGGDKADLTICQPLFDIMGKKTIHFGENGKGSSMKMLINLLLAQSMLAFSEATALGQQMGLDREIMFNVLLNTPVVAPVLSAIRPKLESGNYEANFPLKWIQKDIHLATTTAYEHGLAMPSLNAAKEVYAMAKQSGLGDQDFSAIYQFLNEEG